MKKVCSVCRMEVLDKNNKCVVCDGEEKVNTHLKNVHIPRIKLKNRPFVLYLVVSLLTEGIIFTAHLIAYSIIEDPITKDLMNNFVTNYMTLTSFVIGLIIYLLYRLSDDNIYPKKKTTGKITDVMFYYSGTSFIMNVFRYNQAPIVTYEVDGVEYRITTNIPLAADKSKAILGKINIINEDVVVQYNTYNPSEARVLWDKKLINIFIKNRAVTGITVIIYLIVIIVLMTLIYTLFL